MGLFKHFTDAKPKASKAELKAFKDKLKYGADPTQMYETAQEHFREYIRIEKELKELLQRILKSPNCKITGNWTELDIKDYGDDGDDCKQSPIGKHVYMNVYGSEHPDRYEATNCLCCGKQVMPAYPKTPGE